jgi:hypothetical protein
MGYRSEVAAIISVDIDPETGKYNPDKFKELIGKIKLLDDFTEGWGDDDYGWCAKRGVFVFNVADVKWYSSFPEIKAFEKIWEMASEMQGVSGVFIRLGESDDDTEYATFGIEPCTEDCYLVRTIALDVRGILGKRVSDAQEQTE